jgi:predicted SprT family Zn-dependent metalloprotease
MQLQDATRLTHVELQKWGLTDWSLKFNNRLTRALGRCLFVQKTIELQTRFVKENSEAVVLDTIRHEVAHALAGHKAGHGYEWKMWAVKVGANPEATVDAASIKLTRKYQLAFVKDEDRVRKYERLDCFSDRKCSLKNKMLKGRPETLNQLVWLEAK